MKTIFFFKLAFFWLPSVKWICLGPPIKLTPNDMTKLLWKTALFNHP